MQNNWTHNQSQYDRLLEEKEQIPRAAGCNGEQVYPLILMLQGLIVYSDIIKSDICVSTMEVSR